MNVKMFGDLLHCENPPWKVGRLKDGIMLVIGGIEITLTDEEMQQIWAVPEAANFSLVDEAKQGS